MVFSILLPPTLAYARQEFLDTEKNIYQKLLHNTNSVLCASIILLGDISLDKVSNPILNTIDDNTILLITILNTLNTVDYTMMITLYHAKDPLFDI